MKQRIKKYQQPEFYHFSQDSIELAKFVAEDLLLINSQIHLIDLCSGSGVCGLELYQQLGEKKDIIQKIEFFEKQFHFLSYLKRNIENFLPPTQPCEIYLNTNLNVGTAQCIVLCNPPFYLINQGRMPKELKKKDCHFIAPSEVAPILDFLRNMLGANSQNKFYFILSTDSFWVKEFKKLKIKVITSQVPSIKDRVIVHSQ